MPKFMCIRNSQVRKEAPEGKLGMIYFVTAGTIENRNKLPNHHWVALRDTEQDNLWDILSEKLVKYDIEVDDTWNTDHMQRILAEQEAEAKKPDEKLAIQQALNDMGIKYHHKAGLKSLTLLAREHHIEV